MKSLQPSKKEHQALRKMKFIDCFYFSGSFLLSWIRIANPDTDPGTPLNPDPDPQHSFFDLLGRIGLLIHELAIRVFESCRGLLYLLVKHLG